MKKRKVCSWLLVFVLIVSMFSTAVFADESEISAETQISDEEISVDEAAVIETDDPTTVISSDEEIIEPDTETETDETAESPESGTDAWETPEIEGQNLFDLLLRQESETPDVSGIVSKLTSEAAIGKTDESYVTTGTYKYTSNENSNIQESDTFYFREDCFMRSSFIGCDHLMLLSAQAALASASRYGDEEDKHEVDPSDCGYNIKNMLTDMGFEDVETNKYYSLEKLVNSAGVAVGQRKISVFGKDYTLLAIIPRSAGYKQEWVGNFTVGTGYVHEGFKAGRDEILRFVKQYISEHEISGNLKVWITGHSRGSALSNLLGGFFAGGGAEYFGDSVSITPEDVYCYTFATPKTIREGLNLAEALSVEGYRGGVYENDTPGEAYVSEADGTVDPRDEVYGGIRNYPLSYDFITYLPMSEWGFTYYGSVLDISTGLDPDSMVEEMASVNPFIYGQITGGGDYREFREKTFDPASLSLVDKENGAVGREAMEYHVKRLISGLVYTTGYTTEDYVNSGYQTAMQSLAGVYGMMTTVIGEKVSDHTSEWITPVILGYLAYASKHLQEEGRAESESEAVMIAVDEMLQYFSGEEIGPEDSTIDSHILLIFKYLADHSNSELVKKLNTLIDDFVPQEYYSTIKALFGMFHPDPDNASVGEIILALMKAAAYGAEQGTTAYEDEDLRSADSVRTALYVMLPTMLKYAGVQIDSSIIGYKGSGSFKEFVNAILPLLMNEKNEEGEIIKQYETLAEAADAALLEAIEDLMKDVYPLLEETYPADYVQMAKDYVNGVKQDITKLREVIFNILLYSEGSFNTETNICNISSFIGNLDKIPPAHYNEVFVCWAKAAVIAGNEANDHYISYVEESADTQGEHGEYWLYHEASGDKIYKDRSLSEEGKLIHTWGKPVYEWSDDYSRMTATRVCENNPEHVQTETVESGSEITTPATCEEKGKTTYTAVFTNPDFKTQTKTVKDVPKTGHNWGKPVYKWSDNYSKITATSVCANDPEHIQTETVDVSSEITTPATCTEKGRTTYTAEFTNPLFRTQNKTIKNIQKLPHSYETTVNAATQTNNGSIVTTCTVCGSVESTKVIPAIQTIELSDTGFTYSGAVQKPTVTVLNTAGKKLKEGTDYSVTYGNSESKTVGVYKVKVKFKNNYSGSKILKYTIARANNKISIKPTSKTIKYSSLKNANQAFALTASVKEKAEKVFSLSAVSTRAKGYISVSKDGKVTVKKGLKAGTYNIRVKVTTKKTDNYKATAAAQIITVIVK